jgi:hypothetical protein
MHYTRPEVNTKKVRLLEKVGDQVRWLHWRFVSSEKVRFWHEDIFYLRSEYKKSII